MLSSIFGVKEQDAVFLSVFLSVLPLGIIEGPQIRTIEREKKKKRSDHKQASERRETKEDKFHGAAPGELPTCYACQLSKCFFTAQVETSVFSENHRVAAFFLPFLCETLKRSGC